MANFDQDAVDEAVAEVTTLINPVIAALEARIVALEAQPAGGVQIPSKFMTYYPDGLITEHALVE